MPSTDYQWLTDRERRFLDEPDQFDQQTQSEIRYRLRRKYAGTVKAMDRLEDAPDLWDKKVRTGDATVECQGCEATRSVPLYEYEQTGEDTVRIDDWQTVTFLVETHGLWGDVTLYKGYCESCWAERHDADRAIETGRVACTKPGCTTHDIHSRPFRECRDDGALVFDDDELAAIVEGYHDRRHRVCPACGRPTEAIKEGEIEVPRSALSGEEEEETIMQEGVICPCGWEGLEWELSQVKK